VKTITLLTDFGYPDSTYSLNIIAEEQLGMLHRAGYEPRAVVDEGFEPQRNWQHADLRYLPHVKKGNNVEFHDGWQKTVRTLRTSFEEVLEGVDVVITHDLVYQASMLWHNMAARRYARDHSDVRWLHWVHSATPSPVWMQRDPRLEPVQSHFPHSRTVYPNAFDVPRVATNFHCEVDQVAVVPHPTDVCGYLGFQDITTRLVQEKRLLEADVILVYPIRLDRGKQVEHVLRTAAALKRIGRSVRVVVVDFHSTGGDKVVYRDWLKTLAVDLDLNSIEVTFTSEFDESLKLNAPREMVRDLMLLCNAYVHPSVSETYSLVTQEAGLCGAFLVLNRDFPPSRSVYGPDAAYYQFSSGINALTGLDGETTTVYDDVDDYFHSIALRVAYELDHNVVLAQQKRIRQERNPDYIFKRFIEPLFSDWET